MNVENIGADELLARLSGTDPRAHVAVPEPAVRAAWRRAIDAVHCEHLTPHGMRLRHSGRDRATVGILHGHLRNREFYDKAISWRHTPTSRIILDSFEFAETAVLSCACLGSSPLTVSLHTSPARQISVGQLVRIKKALRLWLRSGRGVDVLDSQAPRPTAMFGVSGYEADQHCQQHDRADKENFFHGNLIQGLVACFRSALQSKSPIGQD